MKINFELDPEVNALYVRFEKGEVARTLEVEETLFIDVDEHGAPLGMEFVNADDFLPFLRRHAGHISILERMNESLEGMFPPVD